MKLSEIVFRKMNILYVIVFALMITAVASVYVDYSSKRSIIESETKGLYLVAYFKEEQSVIAGVSEITRVKDVGKVLKVDESLTGNQCKSIKGLNTSEKKFVDNIVKSNLNCEIVGEVNNEDIYPYELLVSKDTYDSVKNDRYAYLVKVNDYNAFKNIYWRKDGARIPSSSDAVFRITISTYMSTIFTLNTLVVIFLLLVVVVYFNTLNYIKANTKKTKKKTNDNKILNASISTCTTILASILIVVVVIVILT
ncbi:MAG: hypothetical protein IJS56_03980 [Bacilli bacterium]|nr:hypothetical protein [Bacilli bacterium]